LLCNKHCYTLDFTNFMGCCAPRSAQKDQDQYKCASCGSVATGEAGTCCDAPREKVGAETESKSSCGGCCG